MRRFLGVAAMGLLALVFSGCNKVYVDKDNNGLIHDGRSWQTAYKTLQEGIDKAAELAESSNKNTEIWVAEGVYDEARDGDAESPGSLMMRSGVYICGGFAGDETEKSQRDPQAHPVIIDGSKSNAGAAAYHTIVGTDGSGLDGVTVKGGVGKEFGSDASMRGGGLYLDGGGMICGNCIFEENTARFGGGVFVKDGSPWFSSCTFRNNSVLYDALLTVYNNGGGVSIYNASPTFSECVFEGNTGHYCLGAGVFSEENSAPTYINCEFSDNHGVLGYCYGGGIFERTSTSTYKNCSIFGNSTIHGGPALQGVHNTSTFTDCTINDANVNQGAAVHITSHSNYTFTNCVFTECMSQLYAAIDAFADTTCTINNCTFSGNGTPFTYPCGAVVRAYESTALTVKNSTFTGNSIGGVYCDAVNDVTVTDCIFEGTHTIPSVYLSAWGYGGLRGPCTASIANCLFVGGDAGALRIDWEMTVDVANCTFFGNTGATAAIEVASYATDVDFRNCIMWSNTPAQMALVPYEDNDVVLNVTYCDVQGGFAGTGNLNTNPFFGADYHLLPYSPCVNAGTAEGAPADDLAGNVRDAQPDMGAYEVVAK